MILSFAGHFDRRTTGPSFWDFAGHFMSGEKENIPRTFLIFRQRIEFLHRTFYSISSCWTSCPARIYPLAGHLKISPDMSGETGGFRILWLGEDLFTSLFIQRVIALFPGYLPSPYWSPYWILAPWPSPRVLLMVWPPWKRGAMTYYSRTLDVRRAWPSFALYYINTHNILHVSVTYLHPWNKCPKRGLMTTGGQIPIEKHYRSLEENFKRSHS